MRARLACRIDVVRIAVFAEMAWMEPRPELQRVCQRALATGMISDAVIQESLPGVTSAGAANVRNWCAALDLCDKNGGLKELGRDVAATGEAPVPEQGVYELWMAEHAVIGHRVLAAQRLEARREPSLDHATPLPFEPEIARVFRSVARRGERFVVRSVRGEHSEPRCVVRDTRASCQLEWDLDFATGKESWHLRGEIDDGDKGGPRPMERHDEQAGISLRDLADQWCSRPDVASSGTWQRDERCLAVPFRGLAEAEQDAFTKSFKLGRAEVPGVGSFDNVTLVDVPVRPDREEAAQSWAMARFDRRLAEAPRCRSRAEIRALFVDATRGTPLERFAPELPSHDELVKRQADPARFWSLVAPVDLAPVAVPAAELAPLRVGPQPARPGSLATSGAAP